MSSVFDRMAENDHDPEEKNLLFIDLKKAIDRRMASKQAGADELNRRSLEIQAERGLSEKDADMEVMHEWSAEKKRLYGEPDMTT